MFLGIKNKISLFRKFQTGRISGEDLLKTIIVKREFFEYPDKLLTIGNNQQVFGIILEGTGLDKINILETNSQIETKFRELMNPILAAMYNMHCYCHFISLPSSWGIWAGPIGTEPPLDWYVDTGD